MGKYEKLAAFIIDHIGGKDNIESANHCMTRLRIKLKDARKADREAL
ncbi:MAG: PTS transporter subunit EIIB, partial [Bulleidia sp.]